MVLFPKKLNFGFEPSFQGWLSIPVSRVMATSLTFGELAPCIATTKQRCELNQFFDTPGREFPQSEVFALAPPPKDGLPHEAIKPRAKVWLCGTSDQDVDS